MDFWVFVIFYIFLVEQRKTKNIVQNMLTIALGNKKSQVSEDIACVNGEDCFEYWIDLIKWRVMRNGIKVNIIM